MYITKIIFVKKANVESNITDGDDKAPIKQWAVNKEKPEFLTQ